MNILDNELVLKYFDDHSECWDRGSASQEANHTARRILDAMQQPIRKGEFVLERFPSNADNEWQVMRSGRDFDADIHAAFLRLPDKFQKQECESHFYCPKCNCNRDTNGRIVTVMCEVEATKAERDRLKAKAEKMREALRRISLGQYRTEPKTWSVLQAKAALEEFNK